jgi:glucose-6-phosphate isomerase
MALSKINPSELTSWKKLVQQCDKEYDYHISDFFKEEDDRLEKFSISWSNFFIDFSKNRLSNNTFQAFNKFVRRN